LFGDLNLFKPDNKGSSLQNLYFSSNGFFISFGWTESMCSKADSPIEVNTGQACPLSVPSTVGILKQIICHGMFLLILVPTQL